MQNPQKKLQFKPLGAHITLTCHWCNQLLVSTSRPYVIIGDLVLHHACADELTATIEALKTQGNWNPTPTFTEQMRSDSWSQASNIPGNYGNWIHAQTGKSVGHDESEAHFKRTNRLPSPTIGVRP